MDDKKNPINLDEARQSLESTQKAATDIGERVKEVAYMSDKVNHDRMITEILNDKNLSTAEKVKQYDHEQKLYQRRQMANAKVNGQMQDKQTKNTVLATIGWGLFIGVCMVGGYVVFVTPEGRAFISNGMKQLSKTAPVAA